MNNNKSVLICWGIVISCLKNKVPNICWKKKCFSSRSNPFYEPKTSDPAGPAAAGPSHNVDSSHKRMAPAPPSTTTGPSSSSTPVKPSCGPDKERTQPTRPSPVAAVMGRELASSSPKVSKEESFKYQLFKVFLPLQGLDLVVLLLFNLFIGCRLLLGMAIFCSVFSSTTIFVLCLCQAKWSEQCLVLHHLFSL